MCYLTLVAEDSRETARNSTGAKEYTSIRLHGQVATLGIADDRNSLGSHHQHVIKRGRRTNDVRVGVAERSVKAVGNV